MIGRGLRMSKVVLSHIFTSPALRCVQTAQGVLKTINQKAAEICVEPGLFEWMAWYKTPPVWMEPLELRNQGYKIDARFAN
jgi:ubiquitin-associated SH3 domain-containing protein